MWVLWPEQQTGADLGNAVDTAAESIAAAPELESVAPTVEGAEEPGLERTEFVDPVASMEEHLELGYPPERDILVRAELTLVEGEQGHPPKGCEGWTVIAQTWISETGEIARFEAVSDKNGIAEFHFPDFIHVDWVSCLPPDGSPYALTFYEGHDDLGPDDDYLALLHVQPKKGAFGHVVDLEGRPVAGAVVHAFDDGWTYGLNDWTPGYLTTTTDGAGRFEFEQLPPATWVFAVEPEQWLMINPVLGHQHEYFGLAEIRSDQEHDFDAGTLQVVPMVSVDLTMLGSNGAPAVGASLYLEPLTLDDTFANRIADAHMTEQEKAEAMFSSDSRSAIDDLPYSFYFTSDRAGQVKLRLLRGKYRMHVEPLPGMIEGDENPPLEFHSDQGIVTYRFPAPLSELRGRVIGSDGSPRAGASVDLNWRLGEDEWDSLDRSTDATGSFLFQSVRLGREFRVSVWSGSDAWLPTSRPLGNADFGGDLELVLQPAERLKVQFKIDHLPNRQAYTRLLDFTPRDGESFDPDADWWHRAASRVDNLNRRNRVSHGQLQPGTYRVALYHSQAGFRGEDGEEVRITEIGRWELETGGGWQEVEVSWPR